MQVVDTLGSFGCFGGIYFHRAFDKTNRKQYHAYMVQLKTFTDFVLIIRIGYRNRKAHFMPYCLFQALPYVLN